MEQVARDGNGRNKGSDGFALRVSSRANHFVLRAGHEYLSDRAKL